MAERTFRGRVRGCKVERAEVTSAPLTQMRRLESLAYLLIASRLSCHQQPVALNS